MQSPHDVSLLMSLLRLLLGEGGVLGGGHDEDVLYYADALVQAAPDDSGATHCNTLQHTATHCNVLYFAATHCPCASRSQHLWYNTLQHTATLCNVLHLTATHCP